MGYASKGLARPQIAILRTVSNTGLTVAPGIHTLYYDSKVDSLCLHPIVCLTKTTPQWQRTEL